MSLLRIRDGRVIHEPTPSHKQVQMEVGVRDDYRRVVDYIYEMGSFKLTEDVHYLERGTGIEASGLGG